MKVFTSTSFNLGFYVGTAVVIVAKDKREARKLLIAEYPEAAKHPFTLEELETNIAGVTMLQNGDY